ncbi:MAG: exodeoxyribonuclease VII small subunit [Phycisphaerae bacterium]
MAKTAQQPKPKSFEDALEELETILADIEGGQVALEESIAKYERGHFLLTWCRGVLDTAEKQMTELAADAQGKLKAVQTTDQPPGADDEG